MKEQADKFYAQKNDSDAQRKAYDLYSQIIK
jgi:hypothetical protein